jgi:DNA helicase-2/ATP-dependent DNA helicase PcrA
MPSIDTQSEIPFQQIDYPKVLNASQLEAVTADDGPLLVIAGAGSGKTRTLIYRVAYLVEKKIPPESILLLTFTRKASQEMLARAGQLLDSRCRKVSGGTFHSFANRILRKYAAQIGFDRHFAIADRSDSENLIGMIRKDMGIAPKDRSFPKKQTLANILSRAVNKGRSIEDIIFDDYPHFIHYIDDVQLLSDAYTRKKAENNLIDYDDLLVFLLQLLRQNQDIRSQISASFQYIMVDEYQDTNHIQADILYLLAEQNQNVMVVGDDSQSIYSFRGANFKNIFRFTDFFPEARVIQLEENYRSIQPILDLANIIIDRATEKYSKSLFTRRKGTSTPVLVDTHSENSQSLFIVRTIEELNRREIPLGDIAVLFRAAFHSFDLEIELSRHQIPFIKVGGFKFVEAAHIKDVLAHLRVLHNSKDWVSWSRILLLLEKVGPKTANRIYQGIIDAKTECTIEDKLKSKGEKETKRLSELYRQLDVETMTVFQLGETIVKYYGTILKKKFDDFPKRERDLEHLLTIMERYDNLDAFLADIALEPPNTSYDDQLYISSPEKNRLVLSTIHSAKGLEWHTVFIIWALEGRFPSIHVMDSEEELEEELRLTYVAATRAKENLYFVYPRQIQDRRSGQLLYRPSRFIDMIPENVLQRQSTDLF